MLYVKCRWQDGHAVVCVGSRKELMVPKVDSLLRPPGASRWATTLLVVHMLNNIAAMYEQMMENEVNNRRKR